MMKNKGLFLTVILLTSFSLGYFTKSIRSLKNEIPEKLISQEKLPLYVCPMHNHITSSTQDTCPICGMDLELSHSKHFDELEPGNPVVYLSSSIINSMSIKKGIVNRGTLQRNVETLGKITRLDPTARNIVTSPIEGNISYIANKFQGDDVKQGELLFSVTSEQLDLLIDEYKLARNENNLPLTSNLSDKLLKMGLTNDQLKNINNADDKDVNPSINIYAKEDGFIFIRRGEIASTVKPGYTVFNIGGDYQLAEVTAEIFEREWSRVKEGQNATMILRNLPGESFQGIVSRVEPPVGYTTRSLEVKLKFKINDERISQSMFAQLSINGTPRNDLLLVPTTAVIQVQNQQRVVRINSRGEFQPIEIVAGEESMGLTEVISGLQEGDAVVTSGQFLIDSESQLKAGFNRLNSSND